jgi:uncharacterized DUF497 family protein
MVAIVWDPEKLKTNIEKHGVRFRDAVPVLEDPRAITITDHESDPKERFVILGLDALARVLVVVFAWRGGDIRLISARPAVPMNGRSTKTNERSLRLQ